MTKNPEDPDYTPRSLWECYKLLSSPLGRDHILIKGVDKRNLRSFGEVIRGVGTECVKDCQLRVSQATRNMRSYKSEISFRNASSLGDGLLRSLLALETQTDEDGVPLEDEENIVTDLVSEIIVEMHMKAGSASLLRLYDDIAGNKEVLVYTKYKLLRSFRKAVVNLEFRLSEEKMHRASIDRTATSKNQDRSQFLVTTSPQRSLTSIKSSFHEFVSNSLNRQICSITKNHINPFTDQILLTEMIVTNLAFFEKSKNDLSLIEAMIPPLSTYIVQLPEMDENFLRAYLQILVVTPQVLMDMVVADPHVLHLVRTAIKSIFDSPTFSNHPKDIKDIIVLIQDCITPSNSPQVSF